jgi:hypothetical protein
MQKGNSARRFVSIGVALIALVALTVSLGAGAASAGPGHAVAAKKKKCKKKGKKSAAAAKKKKCKKKKHAIPVTPTPPSTPTGPSTGETVRASVTWEGDAEVDLHVYDALGNHDYYNDEDSTIPQAEDEDQSTDGGPETFTDFQLPSTRTFTFYVCLYNYNDDPTSGDVDVTTDVTDPDGGHRVFHDTLVEVDDIAQVAVSPSSATPFLPASPDFCHGPVM